MGRRVGHHRVGPTESRFPKGPLVMDGAGSMLVFAEPWNRSSTTTETFRNPIRFPVPRQAHIVVTVNRIHGGGRDDGSSADCCGESAERYKHRPLGVGCRSVSLEQRHHFQRRTTR